MKKKIVFLDRDTTDIGDISFRALEALGEVSYHALTPKDQVAERIREAAVVLTNKTYIGDAAMDAAPGLEAIQVVATGVNNVDLAAARQRGIKVFNVSGYSTPAVAQHVFALLLNLVTKVHRYAADPRSWPKSPMFTRLDYPVAELSGKTLGIAGMGDIGRQVARIARAFGMEVAALQREGASAPHPDSNGSRRLSRSEFFETCDVISLHCPLTPETRHMINASTLGMMKKTAILINTGRGDLVNEADLLAALRGGRIAGAGLDVLSIEPPPADHPLITVDLPNLLVTPHTAWSSRESRQRLVDGVVANLEAHFAGREMNRVA